MSENNLYDKFGIKHEWNPGEAERIAKLEQERDAYRAALAKIDPTYMFAPRRWRCVLCGATGRGGLAHTPDCIWRRAKLEAK